MLEGLELLLRKVPFLYTAMTDHLYWSLPAVLPKEAYDSELSGECSDEDYELVKVVCRYFDIENQSQYHDLYLWTDALALADCMFGMREGWRKFCELDLFKSITLPSASYVAMLKRLKEDNVTLELISEELSLIHI